MLPLSPERRVRRHQPRGVRLGAARDLTEGPNAFKLRRRVTTSTEEPMVIGLEELLPRVRAGELITNLAQRELDNPEGAGFDLRAGEIYQLKSSGFLNIETRRTPEVELLGRYSPQTPARVLLVPREYYLVKIIEEITLDPDMVGIFHPRSTLFRSGVVLQTGVHPPGYSGAPTFGLHVAGPFSFELELGSRIAHVNILCVQGGSTPYRGQWQGGRVTTGSEERQV